MATHPVFMEVDYEDAGPRIATITYRMNRLYDDVANNMPAVIADCDALNVILQQLSMSKVKAWRLIVSLDLTADLAANVAANNQVRAFHRVIVPGGAKSSFEVAAWDDVTFDQNTQNMLSAAYLLIADGALAYLADPETGDSFAGGDIDYAQSRTRKSRNIVND